MTLGEMSGYSLESKPVPSRVYSEQELETQMAGNEFADVSLWGSSNRFGLALPKGTKLTVIAPHSDSTHLPTSSIRLENSFCTVTIDTRPGMSLVGAGSYRVLFGMSQEQAQEAFKSNQYVVVINATFSRLRTGNPDMQQYKKWASDIARGLQEQFGDQAAWSKTKDWIILHRIAGM